MAKAAKKKRMQEVAKSVKKQGAQSRTRFAPRNAKAKENVKARGKEKRNDKGKVECKLPVSKESNVVLKVSRHDQDLKAALPSGNFDVVLGLIHAARARAVTAVNTTLIELYWSIGQYISRKAAKDGWGTGTVAELSRTIQRKYPGMTGYSVQNLWRMQQFYEAYQGQAKLSPLVRVLSWTHNLIILSRCKGKEEREFYLRLAHREHWTFRELQRQLERTVLATLCNEAIAVYIHDMSALLLARITLEPGKCGGRPCIRGKRIRVSDILELLSNGAPIEEILKDHPQLERDDVFAAMAYAAQQTNHIVVRVA